MTAILLLVAFLAAFAVGWVVGGVVTNRRRARIVAVQLAALRGGRP